MARHDQRHLISATISTIFVQPDSDTARAQLRAVVDQLHSVAPKMAERLHAVEDGLLAYTAFPDTHWTKIWSNTPSNGSTTNSSATPTSCRFPQPEPVIRLVGAFLVEANYELIAAPLRYIAAGALSPLIDNPDNQLPS